MKLVLLLCLVIPVFGSSERSVDRAAADIADYPYMLSLLVRGSYSCTAALIGTTRAVTAAHCCGSAIGSYSILGGTSNPAVTDCETCVLRDLNLISIHPGYDENGAGFPNDIAVVGFAAVTYNANLQAIGLSASSCYGPAFVVGWGSTGILNPLQAVFVTILTNIECEAAWGAGSINAGQICVDDNSGETCSLGSSSLLECAGNLAGVRSWGQASCSPSFPAVYSSTSYYYTWIINQ